MPVGLVYDRQVLELYFRAADVYLDFPCTSVNAVMEAALHGLPVQRFYNPYQRLMWCDDPALDSVRRGVSAQDEFVAGVLEWLRWTEGKRAELGRRFRDAVLEDHCGASWKSKWLDPAINTLMLPRDAPLNLEQDCPQPDELGFPGLGEADTNGDWTDGMFIAGAILSEDHVPRAIRISGVFRSIRPAFFSTAGADIRRKRLLLFGLLIASLMPNQIRAAMRWMWRAIFNSP
jgi:hypothetical protein